MKEVYAIMGPNRPPDSLLPLSLPSAMLTEIIRAALFKIQTAVDADVFTLFVMDILNSLVIRDCNYIHRYR